MSQLLELLNYLKTIYREDQIVNFNYLLYRFLAVQVIFQPKLSKSTTSFYTFFLLSNKMWNLSLNISWSNLEETYHYSEIFHLDDNYIAQFINSLKDCQFINIHIEGPIMEQSHTRMYDLSHLNKKARKPIFWHWCTKPCNISKKLWNSIWR